MNILISKTHPLPNLTFSHSPPPDHDEIAPNSKLSVKPIKSGANFVGQAINAIPKKAYISGAGALVFSADKANAMPTGDLAHLLQQTPLFQINDPTANSLAEHVKHASNSTWGRYVVVGVSGGLLTVGIGSYIWPDATASLKAVWFVSGLAVFVALLLILNLTGKVSEKKPGADRPSASTTAPARSP